MLGHSTGTLNGERAAVAKAIHAAGTIDRIDLLYASSRKGLWRLLVFLVVSVAALFLRDVDVLSLVPEALQAVVGCAPPVPLIHIVLFCSTLSAVVLVSSGTAARGGAIWLHFLLSIAFYGLYATAGVLHTFFPAVFAAGLAVRLMDHLTITATVARVLKEEKRRS